MAVFQGAVETINEIELGYTTVIGLLFIRPCLSSCYLISHAGDLSHIGIINSVAAAHDHDLAAAGRNSFLQFLSQFFWIRNITYNLAHIKL